MACLWLLLSLQYYSEIKKWIWVGAGVSHQKYCSSKSERNISFLVGLQGVKITKICSCILGFYSMLYFFLCLTFKLFFFFLSSFSNWIHVWILKNVRQRPFLVSSERALPLNELHLHCVTVTAHRNCSHSNMSSKYHILPIRAAHRERCLEWGFGHLGEDQCYSRSGQGCFSYNPTAWNNLFVSRSFQYF